jgi:CheY-like chemotaxis protein
VSPEGEAPTLLLVDDEERILSALRRALRREGWRLLATSDPAEALRWLESEPVDAILSDHKMRGMSGLELLEAAARLRPPRPAS